jgi:tungstate transport system substrate-binding protein
VHIADSLRIASTVAPLQIGLLGALEIAFTHQSSIGIQRKQGGVGEVLDLAKRGGIDAVVADAPSLERRFVADGWGRGRHVFAALEFVLAGPPSDPAGARNCPDVPTALRRIADCGAEFLTRDSTSLTTAKEIELWATARIDPVGTRWYRSRAGDNSTELAREAARRGAYVIVERAAYLMARPSLEVIFEPSSVLCSQFAILPVSSVRAPDVNEVAARRFADWLMGAEAQRLVCSLRLREHRTPLLVGRDQIRHLARD